MYRALYRKWRPQVFTDVSGQSHITNTLQNEIQTGRLSHAYLFTGSRGTGKTTCAKILSKAVNCLNPQNGNPCNECEICRGIDDGSILDVTEIDAASNNGVENIRDLREEVNFTPASAKYRVYIIDEVHMLSTGAFNALLKTLEEPPAHVLFILATTEVQKLPATILSRCQRFDFRRIPAEDIAARLTMVAQNENLSLTDDAALLIARIADGALRDALSILDQCAGYGEDITVDTVSKAAGLLGKDYLFEISDAIVSGNGTAVLDIIDRLHASSCDMERLMNELVNHFRNMMIAKATKNPEKFIVCTPDELVRYSGSVSKMTNGSLLHIMETLCRESSNLKYSAHQRAQIEAVLIRLCDPKLSTDNDALVLLIDELDAQIMLLKAQGVRVIQPTPPAPKPVAPPPPATKKPAAPIVHEAESIPPIDDLGDIPFDEPYDAPSFEVPQEVTASIAEETPAPAPKKVIDTGIVTESDNAVPFPAWESALNQLAIINKPLYPMLLGSSAYRAGNTIFIKAKNTAFASMFKLKDNVDAISTALMRATGENLRPALYNDGSSPSIEAGDPVDSLIAKLKKREIEFIVEE